MAVVYRHIRLDKNEPFYIGIGKTERRAYSNKNRNKYWSHITQNIEYEVEILFDDLTWEKACEKEIELIKLYGRKDLGVGSLVNMTDGGDGVLGLNHSKETIIKIKELRKKQIITQEHKDAISIANTGKIRDEEHRKKTSIARKLTNGMTGKRPWNYGIAMTKEQVAKLNSPENIKKRAETNKKRKQKQNNG